MLQKFTNATTPRSRGAVTFVKNAIIGGKYNEALKAVPVLPPLLTVHFSLLKRCVDARDSEASELSLKLGINAYRYDKNLLHFMLMALGYCRNLKVLLSLKQFWDSQVDSQNSPKLLAQYYTVFINTYINVNQPILAFERYFQAFERLSNLGLTSVSAHLPTQRLFGLLARFRDCDSLYKLLILVEHDETSFLANQKKSLTPELWMSCFAVAAEENDYELTKTIYDLYLMKNYKPGISGDMLFSQDLKDLFAEKGVTTNMVYTMLNILSSHGDTTRALHLVEAFYVHRVVIGKKALTKDLLIRLVQAYCMINKDELALSDDYYDTSVERVLDVLGRYLDRSEKDLLTYKDISTFLSNKFSTYKAFDEHIERDRLKRSRALIDSNNEVSSKLSNPNIEVSSLGNVLANMDILSSFTSWHMSYIQRQEYPKETSTLFINCLLNHVGVHQNFSAIVKVLLELQKLDQDFKQWLDNDLYNIILNSLANSGSSKLVSLYLFKFMRSHTKLNHLQYSLFVSSILRGDFYDQLQYYLYNYLQDHGRIGSRCRDLLLDLPPAVVDGNAGLRYIVDHLNDKELIIADPGEPTITHNQLDSFNRKYYPDIDEKELVYIKHLFQ